MKSFAFAAALIAATNAVELEWGYAAPVYKTTPARSAQAASKSYGGDYQRASASDWDAWGRDQDLSIKESYGKTNAKSYAAESYDEWDNTDADKYGAQAWGKDRDAYGASSYGRAASDVDKQRGGYGGYGAKGAYGGSKWAGASAEYGAAQGGYDNDVWAKQAYGVDTDSRWGKSYDSVEAKSYDNEHYARKIAADDDQYAEDYDRYDSGDKGAYGRAASASVKNGGYGGWGKQGGDYSAASRGYGAAAGGRSASDWDAWGRDQDYLEEVSYDKTRAKAYAAESYDEWDNQDADKWGAQAWGKDRDVYGASSYGKQASEQDVDYYGAAGKSYGGYGKGYGGYGGYGKGYGYGKAYGVQGAHKQAGASAAYGAAKSGYDNDEWAKQAYGSDFDSRWGKSYDSVSAKSYDNESFARKVRADDDQWAEDYDRYDSRDAKGYGRAASAWGKEADKGYGGYGYGGYRKGGEYDAASKAGYGGAWKKSGSDWDAWGRDQDLAINESYDATWAKSYEAESYDEWDNKDDDKYGAQAWGKDRDLYGASSYGKAASRGEVDAYGKQAKGYGSYGGYGKGYGGYGGYGKGYGYGVAGQYAEKDRSASASYGAAKGAYDNDQWAKQAYGVDTDSRWGKSYDSVNAKSYDDEQYSREIQADDDQWAEDYDRYDARDAAGYGRAASASYKAPQKTTVSYPKYNYGYGHGW